MIEVLELDSANIAADLITVTFGKMLEVD